VAADSSVLNVVHLMRYSIHVLEQPGNVWYPCTKVLVAQAFQSVVNMDVGRLPLSWRCAHLQLSNATFYVSLLFLQEVYKLEGIRASSSEFFIDDVVISFTDIRGSVHLSETVPERTLE
jgi:hypothetical protein